MAEHYTDEDWQAAYRALLAVDEEFPMEHRPKDAAVTAVLDAVATDIAARAQVSILREMADEVSTVMHPYEGGVSERLRRRADEIEGR